MIAPIMDAGKRMLAIGTPLPRLFFDPQNTMAISSGRENPNRRLAAVTDEQNRRKEHAAENGKDDEVAQPKLVPQPVRGSFSEGIVDDKQDCAAIHETRECAAPVDPFPDPWACHVPHQERDEDLHYDPTDGAERNATLCVHEEAHEDAVRKTPSTFEADALHTAAGTFPFAMEVKVMEDWIVEGRRHG